MLWVLDAIGVADLKMENSDLNDNASKKVFYLF
jgi:hypothetical protein